MLKFSDARSFSRTATGLLLIAGPALLTLGAIVAPDTDHDNKLRQLAAIAAHKGSYLAGGLIFLVATFLLTFAGAGVIRLFRGPRGVTLGQIGGVGIMLAGIVGAGWYALGAMEYEMVRHKGLNTVALADFLHKADKADVLAPLFLPFLIGSVLGVILVGVAALRTRVVPIWAAVATIIAGPLGFFAQGKAGIAGNAVLLIGLGSIGLAALSMSDAEWDAPRGHSTERARQTPAAAPAGS